MECAAMRGLIALICLANVLLLSAAAIQAVRSEHNHVASLPVPPTPLLDVPPTPVYATLGELISARLNSDPISGADSKDGLDAQTYCLAQAVYFEARSEPLPGQLAVAQVVLNRVQSSAYPDTICAVVFQNERWRNRCQFSFACDGRSDRPHNPQAWAVSSIVAQIAVEGAWADLTHKATHYHADYVSPHWRLSLTSTAKHGRHVFYRDDQAFASR